MTLNGVPCTCGGSNNNCFRCFGTGVAAGSASAGAAGPFIKGKVNIAATNTRFMNARVSYVGNGFGFAPLDGDGPLLPLRPRVVSRANRPFGRCPHCGVQGRTARLTRHESRCPGRRPRSSRRNPPRRHAHGRQPTRSQAFRGTRRDGTQAIETALEPRDRLDASRDYDIFRENGRLGSHPRTIRSTTKAGRDE
jgi:hypothetical protein